MSSDHRVCDSARLSREPPAILCLFMQACDLRSLLAFARCSRDLHQTAACAFAWCKMPPIVIQSMMVDLSQRVRQSLVRFAPAFDVHWDACTPRERLYDGIIEITHLPPHIHSLRNVPIQITPGVPIMHKHLAMEAFATLRRLEWNVTDGRELYFPPSLETIVLYANERVFASTLLRALQTLPALTDLTLYGGLESDGSAIVSECTHLRSLSIMSIDDEMHDILGARMVELRHLTIVGERHFWVRPETDSLSCLLKPPHLETVTFVASNIMREIPLILRDLPKLSNKLTTITFVPFRPADNPLFHSLVVGMRRSLHPIQITCELPAYTPATSADTPGTTSYKTLSVKTCTFPWDAHNKRMERLKEEIEAVR